MVTLQRLFLAAFVARVKHCPYLHPELFREQGRIMVITYCVLGQTIPRLIEVEFPR